RDHRALHSFPTRRSSDLGEQLKYLVTCAERPLACFTFSSAARHLAPRDRFIGWSAAARQRNLRYLAYNARFLILPWVEVPHLASDRKSTRLNSSHVKISY